LKSRITGDESWRQRQTQYTTQAPAPLQEHGATRDAGALGAGISGYRDHVLRRDVFAYTLSNKYPLAFASASSLDLALGTVNTVVLICSI
jgi:hypothetical protein